jgi:hypothetical protein
MIETIKNMIKKIIGSKKMVNKEKTLPSMRVAKEIRGMMRENYTIKEIRNHYKEPENNKLNNYIEKIVNQVNKENSIK